MKKYLGILLVVFSILCCSLAALAVSDADLTAVPVATTADGTYVLVTNDFHHGLALINNQTGQTTTITDGRNAGYYASISADGRYVSYKAFMAQGDLFLQKAMLFEIATGKNIALTDWNQLVGTPAVAADGTVAYTVGNDLFIADSKLKVKETVNLGYHVNLIDFSADNSQITFNDENGQIIVLNLNDKHTKVVDGKNTYWGPKFSPAGDQILAPTVNGYTAVLDAKSGEIKTMAKGEALGWMDNDTVAYLAKSVNENDNKVLKSELVIVNVKNSAKDVVELNAGDATVAVKGTHVAIAKNGDMEFAKVYNKQLNVWSKKVKAPVPGKGVLAEEKIKDSKKNAAGDISIQAIYNGTYSVYLTGMQYIHQVYDTADNFNGNSACGATSALMAIQYYSVLGTHPITVSTPSSHTSNYGWYISNVYTYGRTFNIYGADPNGNQFAGGYGYIIQNNWEDTKTHMAEYIRYHGRTSSVDWSPTFAKCKTDIDANHPFVILTSLTSAGHYITCRGYYKSQYSLVFNDPYGNKNSGYMNYSGSLVAYDWPGYNNGYQNLNTVHCFIWCR